MPSGQIFNIQRFSVHDGPGARTTVFFKGCNLRCLWCHNPESFSPKPDLEFNPQKCIGCGTCFRVCPQKAHTLDASGRHMIDRTLCQHCLVCADQCYAGALKAVGQTVDTDYVMKQILSDKDYYDRSGGGATFSGGECMLQLEFLESLLLSCREASVSTAVDTAGNVPFESFERILPLTDLFLFDVKAADPVRHKELTGVSNERILSNLHRLRDANARIIIRIPLIPSRNGDQIEGIARILRDIRPELVELLPFHKLGSSKYAALDLPDPCLDEAVPDKDTVDRALQILRSAGLNARKS